MKTYEKDLSVVNKEKWKRVKGYPFYKISNLGRVKSLKRGIFLKRTIYNKRGYYRVKLFSEKRKGKKFQVHLLVLTHFGPPKPFLKHICNHKDGIKIHNWIDNLEWATPSENAKHAFKLGLTSPSKNFGDTSGENNGRSILSKIKVYQIKKLLQKKEITQRSIAKKFGVTRMTITAINNNRIWRNI